jgi:hypothetical protein
MKDQAPHSDSVRRAALPEILFARDIALAVDLDPAQADKSARAGRFGPFFFIGGRVAVLREDLLEFLTLRAAASKPAQKEVLR